MSQMKRRNDNEDKVLALFIIAGVICILLLIKNYSTLNFTHMIFGDIGTPKSEQDVNLPKIEGHDSVQHAETVQEPLPMQEQANRMKLQNGEAYQYTDKNGVVTFTDNPLSVPDDQISKVKVHNWRKSDRAMQSPVISRIMNSNNNTTQVLIEGDQVIVPVVLNNNGKFVQCSLLLDTGATHITVSSDIASQLNINGSSTTQLVSTLADGSKRNGYSAVIGSASTGGAALQNIAINVMEREGPKQSYDGLLGMNFLKNFKYHVDFDRHVIQWL